MVRANRVWYMSPLVVLSVSPVSQALAQEVRGQEGVEGRGAVMGVGAGVRPRGAPHRPGAQRGGARPAQATGAGAGGGQGGAPGVRAGGTGALALADSGGRGAGAVSRG